MGTDQRQLLPGTNPFLAHAGGEAEAGACLGSRKPGKDHEGSGDCDHRARNKILRTIAKAVPHNPGAREWFSNSPELAEITAFRNGTLQGGYFILAARSLGLDCGPMSGFD